MLGELDVEMGKQAQYHCRLVGTHRLLGAASCQVGLIFH